MIEMLLGNKLVCHLQERHSIMRTTKCLAVVLGLDAADGTTNGSGKDKKYHRNEAEQSEY
jgi:hypothetical protein